MITAKDIQEQAFEQARKGYDVEEVDVFLEKVAADVDALTRQNQDLRAHVNELQASLDEAIAAAEEQAAQAAGEAVSPEQVQAYEDKIAQLERKNAQMEVRLSEKNDDAAAISAAFISAQKSADAIKEEARVEGEKIYHEAETKARDLVRDALSDKQQLLGEIEKLKSSRSDFKAEYQQMIARFSEQANAEFAAMRTSGPIDDTELAAEEKVALAELRHAAASAQQSIPVSSSKPQSSGDDEQSIPAASASVADIASFGDTTEINLDDID